ncbi:ALF repeat-containing protein [Streptomyces sp. NBRC 110028]|uniref:ALF repeat-containing protein n=1 Tax=Streptomyces sp. NBRC 110028 TaxID=1621260 RepID=UPI0006E22D39|nr:ALF repeat-containing protein [Streptomyces sp. NBRC 110028]
MRPTRAVLLVVATALAPALLFTAPAFANGSGAPVVATAAATSSDTPVDEMSEDDRVAIARILHVATQNKDKRVIQEANKLLDDNSPEEMRAWLETGYRLAQAEDDAVYIARMLAAPDISDALRAAANAALDDGSPETLRYFREVGQYEVAG